MPGEGSKKKKKSVAISLPASKVLVVTQKLIKPIHKLTGLLLTRIHQATGSFNERLKLVAAEGLDVETQTDQSALYKRDQPDLIWSSGVGNVLNCWPREPPCNLILLVSPLLALKLAELLSCASVRNVQQGWEETNRRALQVSSAASRCCVRHPGCLV